jgi:hypothetical protein
MEMGKGRQITGPLKAPVVQSVWEVHDAGKMNEPLSSNPNTGVNSSADEIIIQHLHHLPIMKGTSKRCAHQSAKVYNAKLSREHASGLHAG